MIVLNDAPNQPVEISRVNREGNAKWRCLINM